MPRSYITKAHKQAVMRKARNAYDAAILHMRTFLVTGNEEHEWHFQIQKARLGGIAAVLLAAEQREPHEKVAALMSKLDAIENYEEILE